MTPNDAARRTMVDSQLRTFDVSDRAVLAAMAQVPRERFVPAELSALAYLDRNVSLGGGDDPRTVLAPMILARLLQALAIVSGERALDVGGGLGYSTAVLAAIGARPVLLESCEDLAATATERLGSMAPVRVGPLDAGWAADGPYDCILVSGAVERRPQELLDQLAEGGRLACISTEGGIGRAVLFVRSQGGLGHRALFDATAPALGAFRKTPAFAF